MILKSAPFGGFDKNDTEQYLMQMIQAIQQLETEQGISPLTEFQPERLKQSAFGKGYQKKSVLEYLDFLTMLLHELQ